MRILLVEDNSDHRELMRLALTGHDATWQVEGVVSGEEALRLLLGGEVFDLVFLDYSLPGRDGLEVLEEIRRGEAPPPLVLVTGRGDEQVAVKAMKGGAYDYAVKGEGYLQRLPVVAQRAVEAHQLSVGRKQAEKALRESEERLRTIVEASLDAIIAVNAEGQLVLFNGAAQELFQYSEKEALNQPADILLREEICKIHQERLEKFLKRGVGRCGHIGRRVERFFRRKDGSLFEAEISMSGGRSDGLRLVVFAIHDITERKKAEAELLEKSLLNKTLLDAFPCVALLLRPQTREIIASNAAAVKVGAIPGTHCFIAWGQRQDPCPWCLAPALWATGEAKHLEVEALGIFWDAHWIPVAENLYMHFAFDITERKRAEEEVQASREQMRALAGRLQAVREGERTQIAREIHDELGGALTGLKIDFSLLTRAVLKIEKETVRTSLLAGMDSMTKFIDATIHTVRRIAMELRPGILDDLGLVAALEWQLKDFEKRTGIRCEFFPPVEDISLDADLSTALFRIFQEALTNVARHSRATEVRVRLRADADSCTLEVEDNGKGIKKEKTLSSKSLGLLGMRERAQMFGGRITVTGTPGIGTKVTVEISPVEKRKMDRDQEGATG